VEGHRQPLQPLVDGVAQVALDPQAALVHGPPAQEEQRGLGDAEDQGQHQQRDQPGAVAGGDRPVDDGGAHQRDGELGERGQQRRGERQDHEPAVRAGERPQPEQRRESAPVRWGLRGAGHGTAEARRRC
jgi:hypothetical protein